MVGRGEKGWGVVLRQATMTTTFLHCETPYYTTIHLLESGSEDLHAIEVIVVEIEFRQVRGCLCEIFFWTAGVG